MFSPTNYHYPEILEHPQNFPLNYTKGNEIYPTIEQQWNATTRGEFDFGENKTAVHSKRNIYYYIIILNICACAHDNTNQSYD